MLSENAASNRSTHLFVDPFTGIRLSLSAQHDKLERQDVQVKAINLLIGHMNDKAEGSDDPEANQKGYLSVLDEIGRLLKTNLDVFPKEQRNIEVVRNFLNGMLLSKIYEQESYKELLDKDKRDDREDGQQPAFIFKT